MSRVILVLGDKAVGKSSFLHFMTTGQFLDSYTPTTAITPILWKDMLFVESSEIIDTPMDAAVVFCNVDDTSYHYASQQIFSLLKYYPTMPIVLAVNDKHNDAERNKYFMNSVWEYLRYYSVQTHLISVQTGVGCLEVVNALRLVL